MNTNHKLQHSPVAIIGMASTFAKARNLREYWDNIINKNDCITEIPASRWNIKDYYDPNPQAPDKTYCKRGGFIPDFDFAPMEFGLPPNILEVTDVSQILSLVIASCAMEDAGYGKNCEFNRETTGVVLGISQSSQLAIPLSARLEYPVWEKVLKSSGLRDEDTQKIIAKIKTAYVEWNENAFPGMLPNVIAGRIANRFNFGGTNCVVDAACASSLAALKMAISELVEHRCDMILTGGVDTNNSINTYISFTKTPAMSLSGNIRPFDVQADGMMVGEGVGMFVLKRLEDAQRDNDKIYAVIKGIGTSSDGRHKSIYAPRKDGQVKALERAYKDAGFSPETIGLIEAHGTGTTAGDITEFDALNEFFCQHSSKLQHIGLGSVKSQIGHTKAAAGAASLIKVALALHHKILPPTINVTQPNPKFNIKNSPFYLNTETKPWIKGKSASPRRAGLSSFGFGGTNYHVVLEEYEPEQNHSYRLHGNPCEIFLFADSPGQLLTKCQEILNQLKSDKEDKNKEFNYLQLADDCKSIKIPGNAARVGFVANSCIETCQLLQITIDLLNNKPNAPFWESPQGIYYRASGINLDGKVVALFSGQGSQYLEMGRELVINFPEFRQFYGYMDELLIQENLKPISDIVFPPPVFSETEKDVQNQILKQTEYSQPAIGAFSAGIYKILKQAGFKPDFVAGHSFGELTALWSAGVFSDEDFCFLVKARGLAMAAPQDSNYDAGAMLAVKADINKVKNIIQDFTRVRIANFNSPLQIVLAGNSGEIKEIQQILQNQGITEILLPVSAAFHTPLIDFARKSFATACNRVKFNHPQIPVYTNVTAKVYPQQVPEIRKNLENHISNPVLFQQQIEKIYADGGYCFVEFGAKRILTNLVKETLGKRPHLAIALNPSSRKNSDRSLREAFVQLRVAGLNLQHIDPYQAPFESESEIEKKNNFKVRFSCNNYVSDETKNKFENALRNNHEVKLNTREPRLNSEIVDTSVDNYQNPKQQDTVTKEILVKEQLPIQSVPEVSMSTNQKEETVSTFPQSSIDSTKLTEVFSTVPKDEIISTSQNSMKSEELNALTKHKQTLEGLENFLHKFQQHQADNVRLHEQYLSHQQDYIQTFSRLIQKQNSLCANGNSSKQITPILMEKLEHSMSEFHQHHRETLRIHKQYLKYDKEYSDNIFQTALNEYSQLIDDDSTSLEQQHKSISDFIPNSVPNSVPYLEKSQIEAKVENKLGNIAVDTNGNNGNKGLRSDSEPVVEKLNHTQEDNPVPSNPQSNHHHTELQTKIETNDWNYSDTEKLQESVSLSQEQKNGFSPEVNSSLPELIVETKSNSTSNIDFAQLSQNLLEITSDKTGYPVEMLELDMDMEADLGIDSIKRVEILGAMQELYPDSPKPNPEEIATKRTIAEIVEYLTSLINPQSHQSELETLAVDEIKNENEQETTIAQINLNQPQTDDNFLQLSQTLLEITSDKTGYPVEMLEVDMDMEADLGIDSIKRVEILGAMQEFYPNSPKADPEELATKQTIAEIAEYLQQVIIQKKNNQLSNQQIYLDSNIVRYQVKLKTLRQPDFLEFSLPDKHICLITDDGSPTTTILAHCLIEKGWKVVVLSFPLSIVQQSSLPQGVNRVTLTNLSEEHLQQQLAFITVNYGSIAAFIHLNPIFNFNHHSDIGYQEKEKNILENVFLIAKHLNKSLNQSAIHGRSCFLTVARLDGAFGLENKLNSGAISGGLFGLTKSLNREWSKVFCRGIDLSPTIDFETSANHIIAEIHDPNVLIQEVAYGLRGRTTLITENNFI